MMIYDPNLNPKEYFQQLENTHHRQYLAMRDFFYGNETAASVAKKHGYTVSTVYALARDFKLALKESTADPFFKPVKLGRRELDEDGTVTSLIVALRKNYMSVPEIKSVLEASDMHVSHAYIQSILKKEGFARLPRRDTKTRQTTSMTIPSKLIPEKTRALDLDEETFTSQLAGVLCFLPVIAHYEIDQAIMNSSYPETRSLSRNASIYAFLALKLSSIKRYSADDLWCMDRGMGLFAGLNVLPKAAWFSSYSSAVTRDMNMDFLKRLYAIWVKNGMISDTANLDFTTIPYWGDGDALENNWSGKRNKALPSMLALLVQQPDSGIICYGDVTLRHADQNDAVLEFLDFHKKCSPGDDTLKYLVFDSKATSFDNLDALNKKDIRFVTIRRRGAKLVERIAKIPKSEWRTIRVPRSNGKGRNVMVFDEKAQLKGYDGEIRQVYLTGMGR